MYLVDFGMTPTARSDVSSRRTIGLRASGSRRGSTRHEKARATLDVGRGAARRRIVEDGLVDRGDR